MNPYPAPAKATMPDGFSPFNREAASPSLKMLLALGATGKHVYAGTVPAAVTARRRARNKAARIARRVNR